MEDGSVEEAVVVRYLLGDLPEETSIEVEDRAFSDPEYLRLVEAIEADLIDAYVHDQLQAGERELFERRFFASAERRKKVEFARTLARVSGEAHSVLKQAVTARPAGGQSWRDYLSALFPAPAFRFAMAAAALLLLAAVSWQIMQSSRLRGRIQQLEAERNDQQQRVKNLESSLAAERARADGLSSQIVRGPAALVASLTFVPGSLRGELARPELAIGPGSQIARLEVPLEPKDRYPQYEVELHTLRGEPLLVRSNLGEQRSSTGRAIVVDVPASALNPGEYELTIKGMRTGKPGEDIGYYRFSVRRP